MGTLSRAAIRRARRFAQRLPAPVQAGLRVVWRRFRPARAVPARPVARPVVLTVVVRSRGADVPPECLASLRAQTLAAIEVVVAADDAVDAAVRDARGEFLAFLDAGDVVPPRGYQTLVDSLRRTGSDFAAGSVQVVRRGRPSRPAWALRTHAVDRPGVRLNDFPAALQDVCLSNRVFRKRFWTSEVGGLGAAGTAAGAIHAVVTAMLRARRFDLLATVTAQQHRTLPRHALVARQLSTGAMSSLLDELEATWRLVTAEAGATAAAAWLGRLIDVDLGDLALGAQRGDAGYRSRLQAAAQHCLEAAGADVWPHVRLDRKVRLWLVARGDWSGLELAVEYFRLTGPYPPTEAVDGRLRARVGVVPVPDLPEALLDLGAAQTVLTACLERASWSGPVLTVSGWAAVRGLDLAGADVALTAELVEAEGDRRLSCPVRPVRREAANRWAGLRYCDVADGGFEIELDTRLLGERPARWQLRIGLAARGIFREGPVLHVAAGGVGRSVPSGDARAPEDPVRVVPTFDPELGFGVRVRRDRVRALRLEIGDGGLLSGRVVALRSGPPLVGLRLRSSGGTVEAALGPGPGEAGHDGRPGRPFAVGVPVGGGSDLRWEVRMLDADGRAHRLGWPAGPDRLPVGDGRGLRTWRRSSGGYVDLLTDHQAAEVVDVRHDGGVTVDLRLTGLEAADCGEARLVGPHAVAPVRAVAPVVTDGLDRRVRLEFDLRAARWGGPVLPLPGDDYAIQLGEGRPAVTVAADVWHRFPDEQLGDVHRVISGRGRGGVFRLRLEAPYTEEERSQVGRQRLSDWYAGQDFPLRDAVLFQSYRGEFATDSQLAVHQELRRRGRDLDLVWGVIDHSVPVPEGGRALLMESRAWFEALGASRFLCRNIDVERYFVKRPGQRYLQTFHGYPFKSMGASLWRAQGRAEPVIRREQVRRSSAWDAIVLPAEFCADLYRREYDYRGRCLVTGYPRNDVLVNADADRTRTEVLQRLGIDPRRTVVLYAPTWRDTGATSAWTATLFDELDLGALAAAVGDDVVVLLRGHNYNLRHGIGAVPDAVLDVSAYPAVEDLILAADVAVLDYSSLRFDWMITGKPVLFFVPDLDDYLKARTVLYDYLPTAPGPLLASTQAVAAALLDLPAVADEYAAARTLFNQQYNLLHDGKAAERVVDAFF